MFSRYSAVMAVFSARAVEWLDRFARAQGVELLRLALEADGCGQFEGVLYPSAPLEGDVYFTSAVARVAIDPLSDEVLGPALVDIAPDGSLEIVLARAKGAKAGGG